MSIPDTSSISATPTAELLPESMPVGPGGVDRVEEVLLEDLRERFGSPLWVVSAAQLRTNHATFETALRTALGAPGDLDIAYSVKSNNTRAVLRTMAELTGVVDVSSPFELELALRAGITGEQLIVNGNGKSPAYLRSAASVGVRQVNVDSLAEVERLEAVADELGTTVSCVVSVTLGYEALLAEDPSYERTLRVAEGKFGNELVTGTAAQVAHAVHDSAHLVLQGLSHHAGFAGYRASYSPERQLGHVRECARELSAFARALLADGLPISRIDLGGGFRSGRHVLLSTPGGGDDSAYHRLPTADEYARALADGLRAGWGSAALPRIQVECGGFMTANAVVLLTTVQDVKDATFPRSCRYLTVDASMMTFTSRGSSRVGFPVVLAGHPAPDAHDPAHVEVVGSTCAYDAIAEAITLPPVEVGDCLVLLNQGAYAEVTSTQFNAIPRPAVVVVDGDKATLARRRETLDDVLSRDLDAEELP